VSEFALVPIELRSIEDVARLACALEKVPKPVLAVRDGDGYMVGVIGEELDGSLLFLHRREPSVGEYLCYRFDDGRELAYYSNDAAPLPTVCSPVIRFKSFPLAAGGRRRKGKQLLPIEAEDLQSVVKMSLYRLALDESPGAVYYVPCNGGALGSFIRATDDRGPTLFLHVAQGEPQAGFLRVDPSRMGRVEFARSPAEPGFLYVKLVRLSSCPEVLSSAWSAGRTSGS
jgi:hypothetical protein